MANTTLTIAHFNPLKKVRCRSLSTFLLIFCAVISIEHAQAAFDPDLGIDPVTEMSDELYATMSSPRVLAADFLPDGRVLTLTQLGAVHLVPVGGGAAVQLFALSDIDNSYERGALDIKTDLDFSKNGYFYVTYTPPRGAGKVVIRLSRFKLESTGAATLASQKIIWESPGPVATGEAHLGGFLLIGPDRKFYISVGENLNSANSQDLATVYGSILRLNMDGSVPTDNPFVGKAGALGEIWAYGVRNPFRGSFDPVTGDLIVGDVGGNNAATAREEINVIKRGANYGWPYCEGRAGCPEGITLPVLDYGHDVNAGCCANRAIIGGFMNRSSNLPTSNNVYIFADFSGSSLEWAAFKADYTVQARGRFTVPGTPGGLRPIWLEINPFDKQVYYIAFNYQGVGQLRKLNYTGGTQNRPPATVRASASLTSVESGQSVTFTGSAIDPDGDQLQFVWSFGDGSTANGSVVSKSWNQNGTYTVSLRVSDGKASTPAVPISISVGARPVPAIESVGQNTPFVAGQTLRFTGSAASADGGQIASDALSWEVRLFHGNHEHPEISGVKGSRLEFTVPRSGHDFQGDTGYAVYLTATDSTGLTATATRRLLPKKTLVTIQANQSIGNSVAIDDVVQAVPFTLDTVAAFTHRIDIENELCVGTRLWKFQSWSSGASREHVLTVPNIATHRLTATYIDTGTSSDCGAPATQPTMGVPSTPGNLVATRYSRTAGELFWNAATDNGHITAYRVLKDGREVALRDARSYFDSNLVEGKSYTFEVQAVDNSNLMSVPARVVMPIFGTAVQPEKPATTVGLPSVSGLRAAVYSQTAAELFWQRITIPGKSIRYAVYRDGKLLKIIDGTSYFDGGLIAGVRHAYEVVTLGDNGEKSSPAPIQVATGPLSTSSSSSAPGRPSQLTSAVYSRTAAELFWKAPTNATGLLRYEISRNGQVVGLIDGLSYFDDTLSGGVTYLFGVSTVDSLNRRSDPFTIELVTPR